MPSAKDWAAARHTAAAALAAGRLRPLPLTDRPGHAPQTRGKGNGQRPPDAPPPEPVAATEMETTPEPETTFEFDGEAPDETEPPARQREHDDFVLPIEFSENRMSYLFSDRHQHHLVHVHGWGKWLRYHAGRWHEDHAVRVYDAARAICAEQGERARHTLKSGNKVAAIINKAGCIAAIERLARHHEPQTRARDLFDAEQGRIGGPSRHSNLHRNRKE